MGSKVLRLYSRTADSFEVGVTDALVTMLGQMRPNSSCCAVDAGPSSQTAILKWPSPVRAALQTVALFELVQAIRHYKVHTQTRRTFGVHGLCLEANNDLRLLQCPLPSSLSGAWDHGAMLCASLPESLYTFH